MIKFYRFLFLTIFVICLSSCSFDKKTGIWKNERKQKEENVKLIKLSDKGKVIQEEINKDFLICAVGGYGRKHLAPYSDIDLLFVYNQKIPEKE